MESLKWVLVRCWPLGSSCEVNWDAWAAVGTWMVGLMAAAVAWITYLHRKDEVKRAAHRDFQARAARHEKWLLDLHFAKYPFAILSKMEEISMPEIYKSHIYPPLSDFYDVCVDALPDDLSWPPGSEFNGYEQQKLFPLLHAFKRVKSCAARAKSTIAQPKVDPSEVKNDFDAFKMWVKDLHDQVDVFMPAAIAARPES